MSDWNGSVSRKYAITDDSTVNGGDYTVVVDRSTDALEASVNVTREDNGKGIKISMIWSSIEKVPFDDELVAFGVEEYRRAILDTREEVKNHVGQVRRFRLFGRDFTLYSGHRADGDGEPEFIIGRLKFKKTDEGWQRSRASLFSFGFGGRYNARFLFFGKTP